MIYTVMYNTSTYWRSHLAAVKKQSGRIRLSAAYIFYTFSNRPAVRSCQILWDSRQCHGGGQLMLSWSHSALAIRDQKEKKSPIFVVTRHSLAFRVVPFWPLSPRNAPATPPQRHWIAAGRATWAEQRPIGFAVSLLWRSSFIFHQ